MTKFIDRICLWWLGWSRFTLSKAQAAIILHNFRVLRRHNQDALHCSTQLVEPDLKRFLGLK